MGKKYRCDFCDKSFSDNLTSRRRHFQGISHQRNKKNHYDSFRAQIQLEERVKRMSYMHDATGEQILKSWLAKRPDIVKRCKEHGIPVDVAEEEPPYLTSDSCFLQHATNSHNGFLDVTVQTPPYVTSQPYSATAAVPSNVPPSMPLPHPRQTLHQGQPTANLRHNAPLLLQPLSQSPPALFYNTASPMAAHRMYTHSTTPPHMQPPHPTPPHMQPPHPTPPHMQPPHPAPPHMQPPHPTPPHMQPPRPAPPHMQPSRPTPPHMQPPHPTPPHMQPPHLTPLGLMRAWHA